MKIMSQPQIQNNQQPNFTQINLVQVSKNAFKNPEDLYAVNKTFQDMANEAAGEINGGLSSILTLFGLGKKVNKTLDILEHPGYMSITKKINKINRAIGLQIKKPINEDYHSFFVYTKEHKDAVFEALSPKNQINSLKQARAEAVIAARQGENITPLSLWVQVKANDISLNKLETATAGEPINKYVINDLKEIPDIFKKIDY